MPKQPSNFFDSLVGVPVLYDRLEGHYGKTGIPYKFYCTPKTENTLAAFFTDLFGRTVRLGKPIRILSAGAWVSKPGQHGEGKAFDLDAIHWERVHFITLNQPRQKPLYLAVQALCLKYFGTVLGYDYNRAHQDHLHVDIGREVRFRETQSVAFFVQQALNSFFGYKLEIDGENAGDTATALRDTLKRLGIGDVASSVPEWIKFLELVCDRGVEAAADALDAEILIAGTSEGAAPTNSPAGLVAEEAPVEAAYILSLRPDTGLIDLTYQPLPNWRIRASVTASGTPQWFVDFNETRNFYLGYRNKFAPAFVGLARTGSTSAERLPYDHQAYRLNFGEWASFIYPTGRCESEASFLVVNAWDAAAMTFGFFQMAAHTGEHLSMLFRELIKALPDEAERFFPELRLGSQIGKPPQAGQDRLFAVNGSQRLDLDVAAPPPDGMPASLWFRGHFMRFLNPHRGQIDQEELHAAARWVAWLATSTAAREICVQNAVNGAKRTVRRVHDYVLSRAHDRYPTGLDGVSMGLVQAAMDVQHHGRCNRDLGEKPNQSIFGALIAADPMAAFAKIDTGWREDRSKRSVAEIKAMEPWFNNKHYSVAAQDFR
jgi:hypothetical protein